MAFLRLVLAPVLIWLLLSAIPLSAVQVTLSVTDSSLCESFIGFGAEDDGWFYSPDSIRAGVTGNDAALREQRIEWMRPDWVRMFCWYYDWCPSGDWKTFTFDSPNMESHYRTLDVYQRLGTRVDITGVDWNMLQYYRDPAAYARAVGELLEYLIRTKGYTCIKDWTLVNEPNLVLIPYGYTFEDFVNLQRLVRDEFHKRGLQINVVGSDDGMSIDWFSQCVMSNEAFRLADLFSTHAYFNPANRDAVRTFLEERLWVLGLQYPRKPLVLGEFGFVDDRGFEKGDLMETYPYAIWTAALVIEALNQGVAGGSIWTMHEAVYPMGGYMPYGLWGFKDVDWAPRPVYHFMVNLMRLTAAGQKVRWCMSSDADSVTTAVVGNTLFWVNQSDQQVQVTLTGFTADEVRVMTRSTLFGDRECGTLVTPVGDTFTAPARSFGYCRARPFSDVPLDHWAYESIRAVSDQGIAQGFGDGTYHPELSVTRDQMAVYISRAIADHAEIPSGPETPSFSDVPLDHWAYNYIEYAKSKRVVDGYPDGTYHPDAELSRGQMAVFLARSIDLPTGPEDLVGYSPPDDPTFPDVTPDNDWSWCYKYVEFIADPARAVTRGYPEGLYRPEVACTRDQMAVYITNAFQLPI